MRPLFISFRYLTMLLFSIGATAIFAQQTATLTAKLTLCRGELTLYRFNGLDFEVFQKPTAVNDSTYQFQVPKTTEPIFYYIGERKETLTPLLLGTEKEVTLEGNCRMMNQLVFKNSPLNEQYVNLKNDLNTYKRRATLLARQYQSANGNSNMADMNKITADMKTLDAERMRFLDSLKRQQPFLSKIVALDMYLSYQNNGEKYPNEVEYFANEYFRFADFKDKTYDNLPWVYESFKSYTATLAPLGLEEGALRGYLDKTLQRFTKGSRAQMLALSGIMTTLKQIQHPDFTYYAEQFVNDFQKELPEATAQLKKQLEYTKNFTIGGTAPDFTQKTPEDQDLKLSDLRGKVVLVDFWASWCGPCRRENPNVVRVYNEYKDKGFEILSVSLDNSKDRWLQAIQQDGLTWHHVSDLKGWQNEVAQMYNIRSIPQTILLDKDGKILARNLRGPSLEEKLAEIFGSK